MSWGGGRLYNSIIKGNKIIIINNKIYSISGPYQAVDEVTATIQPRQYSVLVWPCNTKYQFQYPSISTGSLFKKFLGYSILLFLFKDPLLRVGQANYF